jgi:ribonuclease D
VAFEPTIAQRPEPVLVADEVGLTALAQALSSEAVVALDTESNSFHVYRERVCLLQISTRQADWVVDPLAVDPRPLGPLLADGREVVLHGADYDVRCLKREYGWSPERIFDTMVAARHLGRARLGLSALVEEQFGIALSKGFQRSDWGRRPLSPEQLRYAALDTRYLLPLYDLLHGELRKRGLADRAQEEFRKISAAEPRPKVFDPEGWRRLSGVRALDPPARAALRALWAAREERASAVDRPPFKVLAEHTMVEIARRRPRTADELAGVPGMTPVMLRRVGELVLAALHRAGTGGPAGG